MENEVVTRIRDYLLTGGLFNPELADHDAVRDLLMECRNEIARLQEGLHQISTEAHCIAKAGPLITGDLQECWKKFNELSVKATSLINP